MTYSQSSPGLTLHLRYLHHDLNPASKIYWEQYPIVQYEPDEETRYVIGAQRTPTDLRERKEFLLRPMKLGVKEVEGSSMFTCRAIWSAAQKEIYRIEQMMKVAGDIFTPLIRDHSETTLSDDTLEVDIHEFPAYFQSTLIYFQLACRRPYLMQLNLLARCTADLDDMYTGPVIRRMLNLVGPDGSSRFEDYKPLEEAVSEAQKYKGQADKFAKKEIWRSAMVLYMQAILTLLPWFPSEYYMAPWEARLNGVGGLVVKCNINLAIAIAAFLDDHHLACQLLDHTASLVCVTNWEMAKIVHLQITYSKELRADRPSHFDFSTKRTALIIHPLPDLYKRRETHLRRPRGALANRPWVGTFSPEDFRTHHLELSKRLVIPKEGWWWENENSEPADEVRRWELRLGGLFRYHCENWKRNVKIDMERDDLAMRNNDLERMIKAEQMMLEDHAKSIKGRVVGILDAFEFGTSHARSE